MKLNKFFPVFLSMFMAVVFAIPVFAVTISVPGTSNPWLAGMPSGSRTSAGDVAPAQSPILVTGTQLASGGILVFSASGNVKFDPYGSSDGPDGLSRDAGHIWNAENGISGTTMPLDALAGVFLNDQQPDISSAPPALDFSVLGFSFGSLSPALKQLFFIGDGLTGTGSGSLQKFVIPAGATRLFLGTMDKGSYNNSGSFTVEVTLNQGQSTCSNDIVTYTAGTPAKAAEVNANFDVVRCQIQTLQALKAIVCADHPTASICQ